MYFPGRMNQPDFSDYHSIIYGHNMRNTTMFGDLKRYKNDEGFYENNQYLIFITDTQVLRYQIFSYYDVEQDDESTPLVMDRMIPGRL